MDSPSLTWFRMEFNTMVIHYVYLHLFVWNLCFAQVRVLPSRCNPEPMILRNSRARPDERVGLRGTIARRMIKVLPAGVSNKADRFSLICIPSSAVI